MSSCHRACDGATRGCRAALSLDRLAFAAPCDDGATMSTPPAPLAWEALTCARPPSDSSYDTTTYMSNQQEIPDAYDIATGNNRNAMIAVSDPPASCQLPIAMPVVASDEPGLVIFDGPRECQICALNGLGNVYCTFRAHRFGIFCPLGMPLRYGCMYTGGSTWLRPEARVSTRWVVTPRTFARFYDKNGDGQRHVQLAQTYARFGLGTKPPAFAECHVGIIVPSGREVVSVGHSASPYDSVDAMIYQLITEMRMTGDVRARADASMCVMYIAHAPILVGDVTRISDRPGRLDVPFVALDTLDRFDAAVLTTVGHLAALKYTPDLFVLGGVAVLCGAEHAPLVLSGDTRVALYDALDVLVRTPTCDGGRDCKALPAYGRRPNLRDKNAFSLHCAEHADRDGGRGRPVAKARRLLTTARPCEALTREHFQAFRTLVVQTSPSPDTVPSVEAIYAAYVDVLCYQPTGGDALNDVPRASTRNKCAPYFITKGQLYCVRPPTAAERALRAARDRLIASGGGGIRHFPGDVIDVGQRAELVYVPDPTNVLSYVSVTTESATPTRVAKHEFYNAHNARYDADPTLAAHAGLYAQAGEDACTTRLMLQAAYMREIKATNGKLDGALYN